MNRTYLLFVCCWLTTACEPELKLQPYQAPFYDELRNIKAKTVVIRSPKIPSITDTILLSDGGRSIRVFGFAKDERFLFDSLNFLREKYEGPDLYQKIKVSYRRRDRYTLIQHSVQVDLTDASNPIQGGIRKNVYYQLDGSGRVKSEVDSLLDENVENMYNARGQLSKKTAFSIRDKGKIKYSTVFNYDKENRLTRILETTDYGPKAIHYYSNGVLDSSRYFRNNSTVYYMIHY